MFSLRGLTVPDRGKGKQISLKNKGRGGRKEGKNTRERGRDSLTRDGEGVGASINPLWSKQHKSWEYVWGHFYYCGQINLHLQASDVQEILLVDHKRVTFTHRFSVNVQNISSKKGRTSGKRSSWWTENDCKNHKNHWDLNPVAKIRSRSNLTWSQVFSWRLNRSFLFLCVPPSGLQTDQEIFAFMLSWLFCFVFWAPQSMEIEA